MTTLNINKANPPLPPPPILPGLTIHLSVSKNNKSLQRKEKFKNNNNNTRPLKVKCKLDDAGSSITFLFDLDRGHTLEAFVQLVEEELSMLMERKLGVSEGAVQWRVKGIDCRRLEKDVNSDRKTEGAKRKVEEEEVNGVDESAEEEAKRMVKDCEGVLEAKEDHKANDLPDEITWNYEKDGIDRGLGELRDVWEELRCTVFRECKAEPVDLCVKFYPRSYKKMGHYGGGFIPVEDFGDAVIMKRELSGLHLLEDITEE